MPVSVAVGEFNSDGRQDLAVATLSVNVDVSILHGNGDGTFEAGQNLTVAGGSISVVASEFNVDGCQDLAVVKYAESDGMASILLGNGDGTFQVARSFGAGANPISVAKGDFNGDARLDLVVANENSNDVSILLGRRRGAFEGIGNFSVGIRPRSVVVGDFNEDAAEDLAVVNSGSGNASVLLGTGDGTFQPAQSFPVGFIDLRSVSIGDFDEDGHQDLVTANFGALPGRVSILLGRGDGTFQSARHFVVGNGSISVTVGDFNGDGHHDLAAANFDSWTVSILLGNGDGSLRPLLAQTCHFSLRQYRRGFQSR